MGHDPVAVSLEVIRSKNCTGSNRSTRLPGVEGTGVHKTVLNVLSFHFGEDTSGPEPYAKSLIEKERGNFGACPLHRPELAPKTLVLTGEALKAGPLVVVRGIERRIEVADAVPPVLQIIFDFNKQSIVSCLAVLLGHWQESKSGGSR